MGLTALSFETPRAGGGGILLCFMIRYVCRVKLSHQAFLVHCALLQQKPKAKSSKLETRAHRLVARPSNNASSPNFRSTMLRAHPNTMRATTEPKFTSQHAREQRIRLAQPDPAAAAAAIDNIDTFQRTAKKSPFRSSSVQLLAAAAAGITASTLVVVAVTLAVNDRQRSPASFSFLSSCRTG